MVEANWCKIHYYMIIILSNYEEKTVVIRPYTPVVYSIYGAHRGIIDCRNVFNSHTSFPVRQAPIINNLKH